MTVFNARNTNKVSISSDTVSELLERIESQTPDDEIGLQILQTCSAARFDRNEYDVIAEVWTRLMRSNGQLKYAHYDFMLSYYCTNGNGTAAQHIYDELIEAGFVADR